MKSSSGTHGHGDFYQGRVALIKGSAGCGGGVRVEAGLNTSTVTLQVVGGNEKGSLESERVKYGHESHGTRTRNDCPSSRQRGRPKSTTVRQ
jgi:hypothetical protein